MSGSLGNDVVNAYTHAVGLGAFWLTSVRGEAARVSRLLRSRLVCGGIIMAAALLPSLLAANSSVAGSYFALRNTRVGPNALQLSRSLDQASDGLLATFFFLVGLELKREVVVGELKRFSTTVVPVAAAFGVVAAPAFIFAAINAGGDSYVDHCHNRGPLLDLA